MNKKNLEQDLFQDKWGEDALSMGWTGIPTSLFFIQGSFPISPIAFNVLLHIVAHWWKSQDWPHPSQNSIAARMNISIRTVQRGIYELEELKLITKRRTKKDNPKYKGRNIYDLSGLIAFLNEQTPKIKDKITHRDKSFIPSNELRPK